MTNPLMAATIASAADALGGARTFLTRAGLQASDDEGRWTPLTGGVSSNLWRVDLPGRTLCVKGALAQLRVADDWHAPIDRNAVEYAWLQFAKAYRPDNIPQVYTQDEAAGFFAMEFLAPEDHPVWKTQLLAGDVDPAFAADVGELLGSLHAESTRHAGLATAFATDTNFAALRLDPFFRVTGRRNPPVADVLEALAVRTARTKVALVHGDVSPKNLLVGPRGPVLLDAECAWFGDPAFDLAFCVCHLLLKMIAVPDRSAALLESSRALIDAHTAQVDWEDQTGLSVRVATLLPALLLARVDGASPVEYLTQPTQKSFVRIISVDMLQHPVASPLDVVEDWHAKCLVAGRAVPVESGFAPPSPASPFRGQ